MLATVVISLATGLAVVVIWEAFELRERSIALKKTLLRWRTWKRFFDFQGDFVVSKSHPKASETGLDTREADNTVEKKLLAKLRGREPVEDDSGISLTTPRVTHLVIGSTKYSLSARELQKVYDLHYEFTWDHLQADPPDRILKIVSNHGQEYLSNRDTRRSTPERETEYGLLFLASVKRHKRIYWISGIHGSGTLGVAKCLLDDPDRFQEDRPQTEAWARQWLIRVTSDPRISEKTLDKVISYEVVGGPYDCPPRVVEHPIKAVISDFGNVLMTFDRDRTYRALAHVCSQPYSRIADLIKKSGKPDEYERGGMDDRAFFEEVRGILKAYGDFDFASFAEWWGDIFWENRSVVELYRALSRTVPMVLLSNTNSLHFTTVREHYPDVLNLFKAHVLSFEEKLVKPAPQLFLRAMALAGADVHPEECVYVDDNPKYVNAATSLGMKGFVYYNYPTLVRDLRSAGLEVV